MTSRVKTPRLGLVADLVSQGHTLGLPLERLFDDVPTLVFFIKDRHGRYLCVNRTLADRCSATDKTQLLGKRPAELFPKPLAERYERQDQQVIATGKPMVDLLELHLYPGRHHGWCLTNKYPVHDHRTGEISGIMGISRDVETTAGGAARQGYMEVARALERFQSEISQPLSVEELAESSGLSFGRFGQIVRRLFQITPRQLLMKLRVDEALHLLTTTEDSLSDIAFSTGFCDQSAFTRHFRRMTGLPPGAFRANLRESEG